MSVIVAIGCRKGGVGKSALAACLASHYAQAGRRALLVDLDPQGNVTFGLGGEPGARGAAELLRGEEVEPVELAPSIFALPGGPELNSVEVSGLEPEALRDALKARRLGARFDVVICDLPPYSEHLERLGLVASGAALVPVVAHPFALSGAARILELIEHRRRARRAGPKRCALVQSMVDLRRGLDKSLSESLDALFPSTPRFSFRQDTSVAYALSEQRPLHAFDPRAKVIPELAEIAAWLDG
jgi:chromosome partitioning protein